ncbi:MAG: hypothetical protein AUJ96_04540 [Armatimonadetes bacterium CG2_30_66_41]|nr:MAG: hypothetical protein AUJ96_04540 [Armatimonadetes bacterium CG2_30_66_41]
MLPPRLTLALQSAALAMALMPLLVRAEQRPTTASAGPGALRLAHVGRAAPDLVTVTMLAGDSVYGDQVAYQKQDRDRIDRQGQQRWVFRDGAYLGSLVGRDEKLVYTPDRVVGDRLDPTWADALGTYALSSANDPAYRDPQSPTSVSRKTKPVDLCRAGLLSPTQQH